MIVEHIASIILGVSFISAFICIFFFTYGAYAEKQTVKMQAEYLANALADDVSLFVSQSVAQKIKEYVDESEDSESFKEADEKVYENNKKIMTTTMIVVGVCVFISILLCVWLSIQFKFNIKHVILFNFAVLACVGVTGFLFLTFIAQRYIIADPNMVYNVIYRTMDH